MGRTERFSFVYLVGRTTVTKGLLLWPFLRVQSSLFELRDKYIMMWMEMTRTRPQKISVWLVIKRYQWGRIRRFKGICMLGEEGGSISQHFLWEERGKKPANSCELAQW